MLIRGVVGILIAGLVVFSSPLPIVLAEEGGEAEETSYATPDSYATPSEYATPESASSETTTGEDGEDGGTQGDCDPCESGGEDGSSGEGSGSPESGGEGGEGGDSNGGEGSGDAVVDTGDASAQGNVVNQANTNNTSIGGEGGGDSATTTATSTAQNADEAAQEALGGGGGGGALTGSTTASTTNTGIVDNTVGVDAGTGTNTASTTDGDALVFTGDAAATSNVVNVLNTNVFNSNGLMLLLNQLLGGAFDLRSFNIDDIFAGNVPSPCSLSGCPQEDVNLTILTSNTTSIDNSIVVRSGTGENTAESESGGAAVLTGDAYAGANLLNVANTNIIDSNYLLVSFNNLGDMGGDIILPNGDFFANFFNSILGLAGDALITTTNNATVNNAVNAEALTGGNSATTTGTSTDAVAGVVTGDATAGTSVVNQVNSTLFGGASLMLLFRVFGDWSGDIFGLPPGVLWEETPEGVQIYEDPDYMKSGSTGGSLLSGASTTIQTTNDATVNNDVSVYALTGENKASGVDAYIETGDAVAGASVVNIVNTNVVGRNWILAVFNIFGDWSGNISFGQPDLWIGGAAESSNPEIGPGSPVTYRYTVTNRGDAPATNVVLKSVFDGGLLSLEEGAAEEGGILLGTIGPGETREVEYTATVSPDVPEGQTPITVTSSLSARETDGDPTDNSEQVTITATKVSRSGGGRSASASARTIFNGKTADANIFILKEVSVATTTASSSVDYQITIRNNGGRVYDSELMDTLTDAEGNVIHQELWNLGVIHPNEEITVTYTMHYASSTVPGVYTNAAQVMGYHKDNTKKHIYQSALGKASVIVEGEGEVLGVMDEACPALLTTFIRPGGENDPSDVRDLQNFLNEYEEADLPVTGVYDAETQKAVRKFQAKYASDILGPWGASSHTGVVYLTTRKKINDIHCGGVEIFALNPLELAEIAQYRAKRGNGTSVVQKVTPKPEQKPLSIMPPMPTIVVPKHEREERPSLIEKLRGWFNTQYRELGKVSFR